MGIDLVAYEVVGVVLTKEAERVMRELVEMPEGFYFHDENASTILQEKFNAPGIVVDHAFNQWIGKEGGFYLSILRLEGDNFAQEVDEPGIFALNQRVNEATDDERLEIDRVLAGLGQDNRQLQSFVAFSII